jgi:hypothetical protein
LLVRKVPLDEISKEDYQIDFQHIIQSPLEKEENKFMSDDQLASMMDSRIVSLYTTAREHQTQETEIRLQIESYASELVSLYCIPYISRSNVKKDVELLEFYRKMLLKPAVQRAPDLNMLRKDYLERGIMESTVIAQVLVWCREIFYVKDLSTGEILQGQEAENVQNIPHLVRMEMTVLTEKHDDGSFSNKRSNWTVTDVDDLLEGNLVV